MAKAKKKVESVAEFLEGLHKSAKNLDAHTGLVAFKDNKKKELEGCSFYIVYASAEAHKDEILGTLAGELYREDTE